MREHPIPQDVTGYRFHIIGNLTLKQFVEVAGGVVAALITYKIGLPAILKWPLIAFFLSMGGLGAFVPIAGRSFDQWVITFFKVIYRPTRYYWRREPKIPEIFSYQPKNPSLLAQPEVDLTRHRHQRVSEYLASVTNPNSTYESNQGAYQTSQTTTSPASFSTASAGLTQSPQPNQLYQPVEPEPAVSEPAVLEAVPTSLDQPTLDQTLSPAPAETTTETEVETLPSETAPPRLDAQAEVTFNRDLPFPTTPTQPNKLVGMVLTKDNDLVPNAIVEVYNQSGMIERAVKSNALGQFFITTPLPNGQYVIKTSKEGLSFNPVSLNLVGQIIPPLEIVAS